MEFSGAFSSRIHHCDWISNDYYFIGETEHTPPVERVNSFKKLDLVSCEFAIYIQRDLPIGRFRVVAGGIILTRVCVGCRFEFLRLPLL